MNQTRYIPIRKFKSGLVRNPIPGRILPVQWVSMVFIFDLNCFYFLFTVCKAVYFFQMIIKLLKNLYLLQSLDSANIRQLVL
jgi:hypothetical protein